MALIKDKNLELFMKNAVSYDYGMKIDDIVPLCVGKSRFEVWCGNDKANIKRVLQQAQKNGFSPMLFACYEMNEGYNSKYGWLNRTWVQGNYLEDCNAVTKDLVAVSKNMNFMPAWYDADPRNTVHFVPKSVQTEGNSDFENRMIKGSVGRLYIPATAAATWEVYYPLGLKKEYNLVQDYAKPLTHAMNTILKNGGVLEGGQNPPVKPKPNEPKPYPEPEDNKDNKVVNTFDFTEFFNEFSEGVQKEIHKMLNRKIYEYNNDNKISNQLLQINKTYSNTYNIKLNKTFSDMLKDIFDNAVKEIGKVKESNNPKEVISTDPSKNDRCEETIDMYIKELLKTPLNTLIYKNIRPQKPINKADYADCSSFIGWGMRDIHPKVWNGGYLHTGTIYDYFKKNGYMKWEGKFVDLHKQKLVKGDIIEFSDDTSFGAGLEKHVGVMSTDTKFLDMNGFGNQERPWTDVYNYYNENLGFNYACIHSIVKNCDKVTEKPKDNKYVFPLSKSKYVGFQLNGQQFGNTGWIRPSSGGSDFHDGVDFGNSHYDLSSIVAVNDGTIHDVIYDEWLGCLVVLKVGGYYFYYQESTYNGNNVKVKKGDTVKKGQLLMVADSGFHLHFGVTKVVDRGTALASWNVNDGTWIDPIKLMTNGKCKGNVLKGDSSCFS